MSDFKMSMDDSLHEDSDLDALIADTSSLIQSVYSILEPQRSAPTTPTSITTTPTPPLMGRRSHNNSSDSGQQRSNSNSPKSPKTPRLGVTGRRTLLSTPSSQEIDREINRIDRFCEMLENNLRSVSATGNRLGSGSPPTPGAARISPRTTPRRSSEQQPTYNQRRSPTPEAVIDLCDSMYIPPQIRRRPHSFNSSSDDVIIVTPSGEEIVDLCSPIFNRNNVERARSNHTRPITTLGFGTNNTTNAITAKPRQRLVPSSRRIHSSRFSMPIEDVLSYLSGTGTATATSTTNMTGGASVGQTASETSKQNNNAPGARSENLITSDTATDSSGRVPFMCAVCMESCVNNQPTSTKCGHVFCSNCIRQAIKLTRKCPMCNTKVTTNQLFRIYV